MSHNDSLLPDLPEQVIRPSFWEATQSTAKKLGEGLGEGGEGTWPRAAEGTQHCRRKMHPVHWLAHPGIARSGS